MSRASEYLERCVEIESRKPKALHYGKGVYRENEINQDFWADLNSNGTVTISQSQGNERVKITTDQNGMMHLLQWIHRTFGEE